MSKKVALVLSSGGARGLAHIGVIEVLEENGYEITSIAGCSMGAVVGAFHACGKLAEYKKWALELDRADVFSLIDFTFSIQGFIKGEKVFKALESILPDRPMEETDIPFVVVTTDIRDKKETVISKGSLYQAMKASVAIPTVIKPVTIDKRRYVDGGVLNPLPMKHVVRQDGDILVVSNVNAIIPYERKNQDKKKAAAEAASYNQKIREFLNNWQKYLPGTDTSEKAEKQLGFFDLLNESIDLMQDKITQLMLEIHKPDVLINTSRNAASTFEFYKAKELIEAGRMACEKALESIEGGQ